MRRAYRLGHFFRPEVFFPLGRWEVEVDHSKSRWNHTGCPINRKKTKENNCILQWALCLPCNRHLMDDLATSSQYDQPNETYWSGCEEVAKWQWSTESRSGKSFGRTIRQKLWPKQYRWRCHRSRSIPFHHFGHFCSVICAIFQLFLIKLRQKHRSFCKIPKLRH